MFADKRGQAVNFIGNLVGSYNDLAELMTLTTHGHVTLHARLKRPRWFSMPGSPASS